MDIANRPLWSHSLVIRVLRAIVGDKEMEKSYPLTSASRVCRVAKRGVYGKIDVPWYLPA